MLNILKKIKNILILIILLGILMALFDFIRIKNNQTPIFNISKYNEVTHIQSYRGLFYQASRKTKVNNKEPLTDSSEIKFIVLTKEIKINSLKKDDKLDFSLEPTKSLNCSNTSTLYYADKDIKIYTVCLDDIKVNKYGTTEKKSLINYLEQDNTIIEDIIDSMGYTGLYKDNSTLMFKTIDNNLSSEDLNVYSCNTTNINDIYITPKNISFMEDFCTLKEDDFRFMFKIEDENTEETSKEKDIIYEDNEYIYEIENKNKEFIFLSVPKRRGLEANKITLSEALENNLVTISDLERKGLKIVKIEKTKQG